MKHRKVVVTLAALFMVVEEAYADRASDLELAHKFSPILILTEDTSGEHGNISVLKPEPVEIVGADSSSNLWVSAYEYNGNLAMSEPLNSSRWDPRMDEFQENN